ncbi:MAG: CheR family methyltransferase, partial [Burkholderiales bacterium]
MSRPETGFQNGAVPGMTEREFPMTLGNFRRIQQLAYDLTGISLSDHKQNMIYGRLARRLRVLGLRNFDEYCEILSSENSQELPEFVNAITTNLTAFFRERHHFDYLKNTLSPDLMRKNIRSRKLRIWSAGCST